MSLVEVSADGLKDCTMGGMDCHDDFPSAKHTKMVTQIKCPYPVKEAYFILTMGHHKTTFVRCCVTYLDTMQKNAGTSAIYQKVPHHGV